MTNESVEKLAERVKEVQPKIVEILKAAHLDLGAKARLTNDGKIEADVMFMDATPPAPVVSGTDVPVSVPTQEEPPLEPSPATVG